MRSRPIIFVVAGLFAGCGSSSGGQADAGKPFELTHQLKLPPGGALQEIAFGTRPQEAADLLMGTLPDAVFKAAQSCAGKEALALDYTAQMQVTAEGGLRALRVDPVDAFGECVSLALGKRASALSSVPDIEIAVNLRRPGAPPVPSPSPGSN